MIARRPRLTENRRSIIEQLIGEAIQNGSRESRRGGNRNSRY